MSVLVERIGAAKVFIPQKLPAVAGNLLGSLASLVYTASAQNPLDWLVNDVNSTLDTTAQYYVCLGALGEDKVYGGMTVTTVSPILGPITVSTANPVILLNIAASNYPSNLTKAMAMTVFLRKNSSDYQIVDHAYIDTQNDFNFVINHEALPSAQTYPLATLQSSTYDPNYPGLGGRSAYGIAYGGTITQGGVTITRNVDQVPINPDNGTQYTLPTARSTSITFSTLPNDTKQIIQANAGKFTQITVNGAHTVTTANMSLQTAVGFISGNLPWKFVLPPDANRVQEIRLYLASILVNVQGSTENWKKTDPTLLNFTVNTVNSDYLLQDVDVECIYKFKV